MKDFILYARNNIAPEISDEAVEGLVQVCSVLTVTMKMTMEIDW